jgi:hypothetical protein
VGVDKVPQPELVVVVAMTARLAVEEGAVVLRLLPQVYHKTVELVVVVV